MSLKARTPVIEHDDTYSILLGGDQTPQEKDRLTDQAMVIAYDRTAREQRRWRLRAIIFDRSTWTRSGVKRWWAAHEVRFISSGEAGVLVPEICRAYGAPRPDLPIILLCHRNTPMSPASEQMAALEAAARHSPSEGRPREAARRLR